MDAIQLKLKLQKLRKTKTKAGGYDVVADEDKEEYDETCFQYLQLMLLSDVTDTSDEQDSDLAAIKSKARQHLLCAVREGDLPTVRACLQDPHCDVNTSAPDDGVTALMLAAERAERGADSAQIMRELLAHEKVDVNN